MRFFNVAQNLPYITHKTISYRPKYYTHYFVKIMYFMEKAI